MRFCRICRTTDNLKYTAKELRQTNKIHRKNKNLLNSALTVGNICRDCEDRLQNYHKYDHGNDDNSDVEVDVDCSGNIFNLVLTKVVEQRPLHKVGTTKAPQQLHLDSDGDTDIIEVCTSRETSPSLQATITKTNPKNSPQQRIVAIIDLEDETELIKPQNTTISNELNIIPQVKVAPRNNISNETLQDNKNRCRKSYDDKNFRLVASLSLLSSDSETDEPQLPSSTTTYNDSPTKESNKITMAAVTSTTLKESSKKTKQSVEELVNTIVKCPACQLEFLSSQRLVHHMRRKHRSYDGNTLSEGPRCAQDSAMTIRLRYMQRYTFYECQLCGRIDAIFKEHKEHVMEKHAAESKSLKDPMMKVLKCPICKEKCGMQYLLLCRHILSAHNSTEYETHLREVTSADKFGWSAKKQLAARVFQFNKRKNYFFQCNLCEKVVSGQVKHLQHLNTHSEEINKTKIKARKSKEQRTELVTTVEKSETNCDTTTSTTGQQHTITQSNSKRKIKITVKKQKISKNVILPEETKITMQRRKRKLSKKALQASLVRVKVKAPLRQFPTQKYCCQYCEEVFKGFHRLNLHLLREHQNIEYYRCLKCVCTFTNSLALEQHLLQHEANKQTYVRKRKANNKQNQPELLNGFAASEFVDENSNTDCCIIKTNKQTWPTSKDRGDKHMLDCQKQPQLENVSKTTGAKSKQTVTNSLQDLFAINQNNFIRISDTAHQCKYCLHLYATLKELNTHEEMHLKQNDIQLIKRHCLTVQT